MFPIYQIVTLLRIINQNFVIGLGIYDEIFELFNRLSLGTDRLTPLLR